MSRRRVPIVPTIVVALAALLMVRLGVWQLHRLHEKEALLARFAANVARPPVALPALLPLRDADLFRRASTFCLPPAGWTVEGGQTRAGQGAWRHIASCTSGAEGPGILVDLGISTSDKPPVGWRGGAVRGRVTWAPDHLSLLGRMLGDAPPPTPLLVAETPAPGLEASAQPDPATVPNNHLAYAVQWFLFAGVAVIIYGVALVRRRR